MKPLLKLSSDFQQNTSTTRTLDKQSVFYYCKFIRSLTDYIQHPIFTKGENMEIQKKDFKNFPQTSFCSETDSAQPFQSNSDEPAKMVTSDIPLYRHNDPPQKKYPYLPYPDEVIDDNLARELERLRGILRRSNKRHPINIDPLSDKSHFITSDEYIFENLYQREIRESMTEKQYEIYSLLLNGYNLKEVAQITRYPYITLRRMMKTIRKIIESVLSEE